MEKRPRRDILKVAASLLLSNIVSACGAEKEKVSPSTIESQISPTTIPTVLPSPTTEPTTVSTTTAIPSPTPTKTPEPTATVEPTPTPESSLKLVPTSLTPKLAAKYIVNGEYADLSSFTNRVFLEEKSGALVLLTQQVSERLGPLLASEGIRALGQSEWGAILEERPQEYRLKSTEGTRGYILSLDMEGNPVVFFLIGNDKTIVNSHIDARQVGNVGRKNAEGNIVFDPIPLYKYPKEIENPWQVVETYDFRLHEETGEIIADDGFQIGAYLRKNEKGIYNWTSILPHERRDGRAELLTPEQRVRKELQEMKSITGYDGTGLWEKTTDENGIPYIKVHETQDPGSKVVYDVIQNEKGNPEMFTIREGEYTFEADLGKLYGLTEAQASLVRQGWNLLEKADPYVDEQNPGLLEKFWRVNKVSGIGMKTLPDTMSSTNWLFKNKVGLILFNSIRFNDGLGGISDGLLGEGYELYAAQYGYGEGYVYTNLPPDCLDKNAMMDANKRSLQWLDKYGKGLSSDILSYIYSFDEWESTQLTSIPNQPQISFNP